MEPSPSKTSESEEDSAEEEESEEECENGEVTTSSHPTQQTLSKADNKVTLSIVAKKIPKVVRAPAALDDLQVGKRKRRRKCRYQFPEFAHPPGSTATPASLCSWAGHPGLPFSLGRMTGNTGASLTLWYNKHKQNSKPWGWPSIEFQHVYVILVLKGLWEGMNCIVLGVSYLST